MSTRKKIVKRVTKAKRTLHTGPNGGTYYLTDKGNKVYVTKTGLKYS